MIYTGVVLFKLPEEKVWQLTPAQYEACSRVITQERRFADSQLGWIRSLLAEPYRNKQAHPAPFISEDFSIFQSEKGQQKVEMSPDEQLEYVQNTLAPLLNEYARIEEERNK